LYDQFSIAAPAAFISGNMFFDLNQNKISDPGEPGINGAGVFLTSDNNVGFSAIDPDYSIDVYGYYIFPRCNTTQSARFYIRNTSNITYDVLAWFKPDPLMIYVSAPIPPSSISNDTLYWNLTLAPYSGTEIKAYF